MSLRLSLERNYKLENKTISVLYVNGKFFAYALEDRIRPKDSKVYGETAIPYGKHQIKLTVSTLFNGRTMPEIMVKGFSGIRIHGGTTEKDTKGCLLLSKTIKDGKLKYETKTAEELNQMIIAEIKKGNEVYIDIQKASATKMTILGIIGLSLLTVMGIMIYKYKLWE